MANHIMLTIYQCARCGKMFKTHNGADKHTQYFCDFKYHLEITTKRIRVEPHSVAFEVRRLRAS